MDTRLKVSFDSKWGHISDSYLVQVSANENLQLLHQEMFFAASQDLAGDLCCWKVVFPEKLWFLSMSYTLVRVHFIMVRGVSSRTSQEKVCSPRMSNDQEASKHTHIRTHLHCELYDELSWWVRVWQIELSFQVCPWCK